MCTETVNDNVTWMFSPSMFWLSLYPYLLVGKWSTISNLLLLKVKVQHLSIHSFSTAYLIIILLKIRVPVNKQGKAKKKIIPFLPKSTFFFALTLMYKLYSLILMLALRLQSLLVLQNQCLILISVNHKYFSNSAVDLFSFFPAHILDFHFRCLSRSFRVGSLDSTMGLWWQTAWRSCPASVQGSQNVCWIWAQPQSTATTLHGFRTLFVLIMAYLLKFQIIGILKNELLSFRMHNGYYQ